MKSIKLALLFLLFAFSLAACNQKVENISLVEQYFEYWNQGNVDGIMSLIADDPQIEIKNNQILTDKDEIRQTFIEEFDGLNYEIIVMDFEVDGDTVTYNFEIFQDGSSFSKGRSQAVIEDGKIKSERSIGAYQAP